MALPFARRDASRTSPTDRTSSTSVLQKSLRNDPFFRRSKSHEQTSPKAAVKNEREAMNKDLSTLSRLFPDVQLEVFRELLTRCHGMSRLQLSVNQLITDKKRCVNGRWQIPPRDSDEIPLESTFRSSQYKSAVHQLLSEEHRYLTKSAIEAVLAENNHSYTRARPTLALLHKRTWRATISNFSLFKRKSPSDGSPSQVMALTKQGGKMDTGSAELDEEIDALFVKPGRINQQQLQQEADFAMAEALNEAEATSTESLFECGCCLADHPFEKMVSCSFQGHVACQDCVRKTVQEALFGQGWAQSVDSTSGSLKCLTPMADGACKGHISRLALEHAVVSQKSGVETWVKFEDRFFENSVVASRATLLRCPFCSYAEADPSEPLTNPQPLAWRFRSLTSNTDLLVFVAFLDLLPFLTIALFLMAFFEMSSVHHILRTALHHVSLRDRSPRFSCQKPACKRVSCLICHKAWHDPHTCHEPLLLSLRTAVEAARTAAVKRTCPRCGLSFVKSSGCNKLTCVCGYSICYICRTGLGDPDKRDRGDNDAAAGYRHFCEHFRVAPGRPCAECNKCDLYKAEDEVATVRRAGEIAEREWRVKEGMVGVEGLGELPGFVKGGGLYSKAVAGDWKMQDIVNWFAGRLIQVEV